MFLGIILRIALAVLVPVPTARAQYWKQQTKELRIGLLGGENTSSRLARYDGFQRLLQETLGITCDLPPSLASSERAASGRS
jgi:phosphonate transport system substrate-binding protein